MMICKEFTEFLILSRVNCRNTLNNNNSCRSEIIVVLVLSKNYSILLIFPLDVHCFSPMEQSSTIDLWNLCDPNIGFEAIVKLFLQIFTIHNSGRQVGTTLNINKICLILRTMVKSIA